MYLLYIYLLNISDWVTRVSGWGAETTIPEKLESASSAHNVNKDKKHTEWS